jgi:hypothetical protein
MRVQLTWELELNLGYLPRLLPIEQDLKRHGNTVFIAVRDIQSATFVHSLIRIRFVDAPNLPNGLPLGHRPIDFVDILLSQGWKDRSTSGGLFMVG